jgi:hypothetical protein
MRRSRSNVSAGTSTERTISVASRTPNATRKRISVRNTSGSTASTEKVAARTMPAEVITPPLTARPRRPPARVPNRADQQRRRGHRPRQQRQDRQHDQQHQRDDHVAVACRGS